MIMHHTLTFSLQWALLCLLMGGVLLPLTVLAFGSLFDRMKQK